MFITTSFFYAQNTSNRLEFDLKGNFENENAFPLGKQGLLIQSFGTDSKKGEIPFRNEFYSFDFKLLK
jgi:hypothetical protein